MKKRYNIDQQFYVVYARFERSDTGNPFQLKSINNETLGLHATIGTAPNNELSDGEVAKALLNQLEAIHGDNYKYKIISILNWWVI